jgi:hypothetical protein
MCSPCAVVRLFVKGIANTSGCEMTGRLLLVLALFERLKAKAPSSPARDDGAYLTT